MKPWLQLCQRGSRFCVHCLVSFACWSIWLALVLLLVAQLYIAFAREMPVPGFLLRSLEQRLAASGVAANFGRTTFDPDGRILVENLKLSLTSFAEPIAHARLVYVELDPWALLAGRFEPSRLRASGVSLYIPAMLSDSGASEGLLDTADLTIIPHEQSVTVEHFTARLAGLSISARGTVDLKSLPKHGEETMPIAEMLAVHYPDACRRAAVLSRHLAGLHDGRLQLRLQPSPNFGAIARVQLSGSSYESPDYPELKLGAFSLGTRLPVWNTEPFFARITARVANLTVPGGTQIDRLRTTLRARVAADKLHLEPQNADVTVGRVTVDGVQVSDISTSLKLGSLPEITGAAVARVVNEAVSIGGTANVTERSAKLHTVGRFDPSLMLVIGRHVGHDLRPFLDFGQPPEFDAEVVFDPGAHFKSVEGLVGARDVHAYHVTFDDIGGHVRVADNRFVATQAHASIGTNFATGSYEHDFRNHDFRFLLTGQLRPPDISGWFREWWSNFWDTFDFSAEAPDASVDVQGRWMDGPRTNVFVYASGANPVIHGTPLDHVTTLIYLRPSYYDAMDVRVYRDKGAANGWFVRRYNADHTELQRMDFDFSSSLALDVAAGLVGPEVESIIKPFYFTTPVMLDVSGFIGDPAALGVARQINLHGTTQGDLTFHDFPLNGLNFSAAVKDDDIVIEPVAAGFAGGNVSGRMRIQGPEGKQRLGFDIGLKQGNLQRVTSTLSEYFAQRRDVMPIASTSYVQKNANVAVDLDVSAEGDLDNPLSYVGSGNMELGGQGLGEIRLLGLLSELLNFTALRFNHLRANFNVEKDKVVFPEVRVTGANSAVDAHGNYSLAKRQLDFNAKIYPFQESKFILKNVVGAVLSPLSSVLEVKLTGELDKPKWAFVIGPTNILRSLSQPNESQQNPTPATPSPATGTTPTPPSG